MIIHYFYIVLIIIISIIIFLISVWVFLQIIGLRIFSKKSKNLRESPKLIMEEWGEPGKIHLDKLYSDFNTTIPKDDFILLIYIITSVLKTSIEELDKEVNFVRDFNIDSLGHVNLIEYIEKLFEINIDDSQSERIFTLNDLIEFVEVKYGKERKLGKS